MTREERAYRDDGGEAPGSTSVTREHQPGASDPLLLEIEALDIGAIDRGLRRIATCRSRIAENHATAEAERARWDEWERDVCAPDEREAAYWEAVITQVTPKVLATGRFRGRSLTLPSGEVAVRSMPPEVRRVDSEALIMWAVEHGLTRQPKIPDREIAWDEVRKRALAGETVPGVEVVPRPDSVSVRVYS